MAHTIGTASAVATLRAGGNPCDQHQHRHGDKLLPGDKVAKIGDRVVSNIERVSDQKKNIIKCGDVGAVVGPSKV